MGSMRGDKSESGYFLWDIAKLIKIYDFAI